MTGDARQPFKTRFRWTQSGTHDFWLTYRRRGRSWVWGGAGRWVYCVGWWWPLRRIVPSEQKSAASERATQSPRHHDLGDSADADCFQRHLRRSSTSSQRRRRRRCTRRRTGVTPRVVLRACTSSPSSHRSTAQTRRIRLPFWRHTSHPTQSSKHTVAV